MKLSDETERTKNKLPYTEIPYMHMEDVNWFNKGIKFIKAKFFSKILKFSLTIPCPTWRAR